MPAVTETARAEPPRSVRSGPSWPNGCRGDRTDRSGRAIGPARSVDVRAAVDVVGGAGDVAGLLAAQVGDEVGDVAHPAVAADGDPGDELGLALALQRPAGDVGVDQPGGDGVDGHPGGPQ